MQIGTVGYNSAQTYADQYKNTNYGTTENDTLDWLGIGSARRQREFEAYMSNTAYQRAVEDMKEAGLNPGLMYGSGGPASTPNGGSSASGKGLNILNSLATLFMGSAKMMNASKSFSLDKKIANNTLNTARSYTSKELNSLYDDISKLKL